MIHHVIKVKMEISNGSKPTTQSDENSSERAIGVGGAEFGSFISYLVDEDDSLLDLNDDPIPQESDNRLLFDFASDIDTSSASRPLYNPGLNERGVLSASVTGTDIVIVSSDTGHRQHQGSSASTAKQHVIGNNGHVGSFTGASLASNSDDILSYGDPTFPCTSSPSIPLNQAKMECYSNNSVDTDRGSVQTPSQTSRPVPLSGPFTPGPFTPNHASPRQTGAIADDPVGIRTVYSSNTMDVNHSGRLRPHSSPHNEGQPDVSPRPQPHATAAGEFTTPPPPPDTISYVQGTVIDYTGGDAGHLTLTSPNSQADISHVMLDSFPPPPREDRRLAGEGDCHHEALSEEIHCHSKINRHTMNDKLAQRQLLVVLVLCVTFMIGETIGGVLANSLALFTDVLHLASDLISYVISLLALYLSRKKATRHMTFGYHRAEVLGALFSVFIIWLVSGVLCYIAVERIINKHYIDVKPNEMLITASLGVVFNLIMGFVLHSEKCCDGAKHHAKFGHGHSHSHNSHGHSHTANSSSYEYEPLDVASHGDSRGEEGDEEDYLEGHRHKNINVRAAFIHVVGDIIQSLGVLVAALIIKLKEDEKYRLADPICTFFFSLLVLCTTINVLRDTLRIIMEGAPQGVDFEQLKTTLTSVDSVIAIHNLNVWALTMDRNALSVHLAVDNSRQSSEVLREASRVLKRHSFYHVTIQVEPYNYDVMSNCAHCQLPSK